MNDTESEPRMTPAERVKLEHPAGLTPLQCLLEDAGKLRLLAEANAQRVKVAELLIRTAQNMENLMGREDKIIRALKNKAAEVVAAAQKAQKEAEDRAADLQLQNDKLHQQLVDLQNAETNVKDAADLATEEVESKELNLDENGDEIPPPPADEGAAPAEVPPPTPTTPTAP